MAEAQVFDTRPCELGEGPLWHPEREAFFWFDIEGKKLLTADQEWQFDECVSAAGWVDRDTLLMASETALLRFDITTGAQDIVVPLEADMPQTRSNDGRADPQGGFWIGTMNRDPQDDGMGSYYRFYKGELRKLWGDVSIPNATCFSPDGRTAYFADTPKKCVWRIALDENGWPVGERAVHLDFNEAGLNPDGAVIDAQGTIWIAFWGIGRVEGFAQNGSFAGSFELPAPHTTCPAFGRDGEMLVTSAQQGMDADALAAAPLSGQTFIVPTGLSGQTEHQVIL